MFKFIKKIIAFTVIFCSLFTSNIYAMTGKEKCDNYIKEVNGNTLIFKERLFNYEIRYKQNMFP